ncbi:fimbrial assembly protein [Shewanella sp. WXL01]|uniref:PilN domain-containing protein n=1 Tax=Shewanella sp. WXL01 TaxID=2709721 RepID=UPI0014384CC6|nr:PilN domain-containing protein [Shewanella sp. WXL01]NKF52337.1 fimbrial assembly protein [Shewanella sp. WXL01]
MTKQTVNLYSSHLLPPKLRLSFKRLMVTSAVMVVVALFIGMGLAWQSSQRNNEIIAAQAQKSTFDLKKQQLEAQIAARQPDAALVAKVELEQKRLELKQLLKGELSARRSEVSMGYSPLLMDLAKVSDSSVWLSRIQVNDGKYEFEGYGSTAQSIPMWVEKLKGTETLKGYSFASMTMNRGEDKPLAFKLTSTPVEESEQ